MRKIFLLASLTLMTLGSFGQISAINSEADIEKLIKSLDKKNEFRIKYDTSQGSETRWFWFTKLGTCDTLDIKPWLKADIDNNGHTDLLVRGFEDGQFVTKIVLTNKNDKLSLRDFSSSFGFPCSEFRPVIVNDTILLNYIAYYKERDKTGLLESRIWNRQLIYKFGSLIEYNQSPKNHRITNITYTSNGCFGECPVFTISIDKDKASNFRAGQYNKKKGEFKGKIKNNNYNELIDLLNYIDFTKLNDEYNTNISDGPSCELRIRLENGETKIIKDATMQGTFGLARLYELFDNLRTNQRWYKNGTQQHVSAMVP